MAAFSKEFSGKLHRLYGVIFFVGLSLLALVLIEKNGFGQLKYGDEPVSPGVPLYKMFPGNPPNTITISSCHDDNERRFLQLSAQADDWVDAYATTLHAVLRCPGMGFGSAGDLGWHGVHFGLPFYFAGALQVREPVNIPKGKSFTRPRGSRRRSPFTSNEKIFQPIIVRAAQRYSIDPALVHAIIFAESGYNPNAVSEKGAIGLMQLMPGTARAMGVKDSYNPEHNIFGGVRYIKKLINEFEGDLTLALAAYNAGGRNVRQYNGVPPFKATQYYIEKVLEYYEKYKTQQRSLAEHT